MIRPSARMVFGTAAAVAPLCAIAGFYAPAATACYAALGLLAAIAAANALRTVRSAAGWAASAPATQQWFNERPSSLPLSLRHSSTGSQELRLHVALPPDIEAKEKMVVCRIEGAGTVDIACTPRRRGDFILQACHIEQVSLLGLWRVSRTLSIHSAIRVYPDLRRERATDLLRTSRLAGLHNRRQLGKGREFEKLRDYEHGDSFEDIDWKATARRQKPVVRVFQIERTQEVYVVIDSSRLSARNRVLDSSVTAALTLAITAESQHDRFGLATFSAGVDTFIPAASGKRHFAFCRDAIYALQPHSVTPDVEAIFSYLHTHIRRRALIVFLTALDDPFLAETFTKNIHILSRRHLVMATVPEQEDVGPLFSGPMPETSDRVYTKLAGHLQWTALHELRKTLERGGVRLAVIDPARLSAQLTREYRDIKQRQLL